MEEQDNITSKIWEYIDDVCDADTRAYVAGLIATDANWKRMYEELTALNKSLLTGLETEEPSVRFTKNVMELIGQTSVVPSVHTYINPVVIRSIAAFFLISIVITTLFAFFSAGPTTSVRAKEITLPKVPFAIPDVASVMTSNTIAVLLGLNVVLGLLFLDTMLRRKADQFHQ